MTNTSLHHLLLLFLGLLIVASCKPADKPENKAAAPASLSVPRFTLTKTDTFRFNNFVDCNMAEA